MRKSVSNTRPRNELTPGKVEVELCYVTFFKVTFFFQIDFAWLLFSPDIQYILYPGISFFILPCQLPGMDFQNTVVIMADHFFERIFLSKM